MIGDGCTVYMVIVILEYFVYIQLWSAMEQEMEGYDKALRDEMTK